jgi:hypothetical protein
MTADNSEEDPMKQNLFRVTLVILSLVGAQILAATASAAAGEQRNFPGWEKGGVYDKHYNVSEFDQFKGTVEDIVEVTPLPGMAPGVGLSVRDEGKELVKVHLGPKDFVDFKSTGLKKGDKVKVKGVWAEIGGQDVFMASKVKKGENVEVKFRRTKDGTPFWTLTPEELAKEQTQE